MIDLDLLHSPRWDLTPPAVHRVLRSEAHRLYLQRALGDLFSAGQGDKLRSLSRHFLLEWRRSAPC